MFGFGTWKLEQLEQLDQLEVNEDDSRLQVLTLELLMYSGSSGPVDEID